MVSLGLSRRLVVLCLLVCVFIPAAFAQVSLSVSPLQVNYIVAVGAVSLPKNLEITTSVPTTVVVDVIAGSQFISVQTGPVNVFFDPASGLNKLSLPVRVNATALAPASYQGTIRIATASQQVLVTVVANVGGVTALTASPGSLTFTAAEGSLTGMPGAATVQILSSAGALNYTIQATTASGGSWLNLSASTGTSGDAGFLVSVSPAALAPGTYTGTIFVESLTTADAVQIAVTLTVGSTSTISVSPTRPPTFLYQIGGGAPTSQTLLVSSSGGSVPFTVAESPDVSWLTVTPLAGTAGSSPAVITLSINTAQLVSGAYTTNVIITPVNGTPLTPVPVSLAVSSSPLLQVSRSSLNFSTTFGGAQPAGQTVNLTAQGTGGELGFNITGGPSWLTATPSVGTTPATITVNANPTGLAIGTYNSSLIVRPSNGDQYFHEIRVSFTILDRPRLSAGPAALLFSHQTGTAPPQSQTFQLRSTGPPISFSVFAATSTCGPGWLSALPSQNTTPATVSVSIFTIGLAPGICSGTVEVRFDGGSGLESLVIPVTAAISQSSQLRVTLADGFGDITVTRGGAAPAQLMSLTSTNPNSPVTFTMVASSQGGTWLTVPANGTTPSNIGALILSGGLEPGTYTGQIVIGSPSLATNFTIPVRLTVIPEIIVSVSPQSLSFSQTQGGTPSPSQRISMLSIGGVGATFTATVTQITGGDWLQINRTSGTASGDIDVSIKPNSLPQGTYTSRITLVFGNSISQPVQIPVSLNVVQAQTVSSSVQQLNFGYQTGGTVPAPQTFNLTSSPGPINFTVATTSSGWLSLNAQSGTTPAQLTASVNVAGLAAGTYNGSITITAPGAVGSPLNIPVTLTISGPPAPIIDSVANSGSNLPGPITGGEILTLKGIFLPSGIQPAQFIVNPGGTISATLIGIRVLFDGIPGTPIYVSRTQINVIAPYEILNRAVVQIVVEYQGVPSASVQAQVLISAPGIFTLDATGLGQAAALNANGTFNGPANGITTPSPPGSTIVIYLTGGGQTTPNSLTGTVTGVNELFRVLGVITAEIGGQPAAVEFIGGAPGLVAGVIQANLRPNANVHGNVAVRITINGNTSPAGPMVAIQ